MASSPPAHEPTAIPPGGSPLKRNERLHVGRTMATRLRQHHDAHQNEAKKGHQARKTREKHKRSPPGAQSQRRQWAWPAQRPRRERRQKSRTQQPNQCKRYEKHQISIPVEGVASTPVVSFTGVSGWGLLARLGKPCFVGCLRKLCSLKPCPSTRYLSSTSTGGS